VALGASILEKHFTSDKDWQGPDIPISINPRELRDLIEGTKAIQMAVGGTKDVLPEEQPTINFAYACVVAIRDIKAGERLSEENIWVKRPGSGEIKAVHFESILNKKARREIRKDSQLKWSDLS
jgi:N-acetylneuraminate synthase